MIDLNRPRRKPDNSPTNEQLVMLIICVVMWVTIILGIMMS